MTLHTLLTFDPGGTTGWSMSVYTDTEPLSFIDGGQIPDGVEGFVQWWQPLLDHWEVVSESFQLRPSVKSPDVTPLRIEGALTALLGPGRVIYQQPATKALVTDEKLRELGFWIPGQRHQMDARIHALAYMKRIKHIPTLGAYFHE